jgi:hypothetical protein
MAYEPKDLTGSLFKNDRKEADTHPDYKGSALIGGVDHWLDAWINEDRNGNKYMSLKFKPKQASSGRGESRQPYAEERYDDDSDVPF